jgi:sigma-B regulation protein RsbU (phosphoserine phosphatase)
MSISSNYSGLIDARPRTGHSMFDWSGADALRGVWTEHPWIDDTPALPQRRDCRRLDQVVAAAVALGAGEEEPFVPVDGEGEMSLLARAFNAMAAQIRAREERLRAALHREQRIASTLQQAFRPQALPECPGYRFAAAYHPALQEAEVGGDFYDVFSLPAGRLGLLLGDVAGKGLQAANTATMTRYTTRAYALKSPSPGAVLGEANRALCESIDDSGLFVTAFYAVLDPAQGGLNYAAAGHWPALVARREGVETVGEPSLALGICSEAAYEEGEIRLAPGDGMLLYTDGLVEVGESDPMDRLAAAQRALGQRRAGPPEQWVDQLYQAARRQSGGHLRDDLTLLALRRD